MRITSPSTNWTIAQNANQKILQWKIYARKVTTLNQSLTGGDTFTDITEYITEIPTISQAIELEAGQFTSDSFTLNCIDINYWLVNWLSLTSAQEIEVKVVFNMGVSSASMSTDNCIVASGFVDKMSFDINEANDSVSFSVESYDEYANRITGKNLTLQKTRSVGGVTCLVCNKIPGVYIYIAAPYMNMQIINFKWNENDSVYQMQYNGGEFTILDTSGTTPTTIRDENNKYCTIYLIPSELEKISTEQKFIFKNASDSLPYSFYSDETISNMLTNIGNEMPIVSSSITAPTFATYDGGYRLTNLENIANDIGNATPKCMEWDSTNSLLWVGVGNKLYTRTGGGTWTLKTTCDNGTIKRIWVERVGSNEIWLLLRGDSDENFQLAKYLITTGNKTEYDTSKLIGVGNAQYDYSNFFMSNSSGIYFLTSTYIRYLSFTDYNFYDAITATGSNPQTTAFFFYSVNYGYYYLTESGGTYSLYRKTGGAIVSALPGIIYDAIITTDTAGVGIIFYFTTTDGKLYKYIINSAGTGGSYAEVLSGIVAYGLYKNGNNIYFYANNSKVSSTYYSLAYVDSTTNIITSLSNTQLHISADDYKIRMNQLVYVSGIIYFLSLSGRFYYFSTSNTNRINGTYDTSSKSIRDCLNEFCRIYNLIYILKPNKTLVIFPRSDSSGTIQTNGSASNLTIDTSTIVNVQKKLTEFGKANKIKVESTGFTGEYNGTDYDLFDGDGDKIIEIQSDLLQHSNGYTLRDMAKHFYPFYSKELIVLNCEYGILPALQYEVSDGANVDLTGTKINIYGSQSQYWNNINEDWQNLLLLYNSGTNTGLIQKQTINSDGSINLEILI